jgi:hypothetical protein
MGSPQSTSIRRGIVALAAALLLAVLAAAAGAATPAPEPPPVSCITDNPVDPLGPGFLLSRDKFTTINHPKATLETAPYGINNRAKSSAATTLPASSFKGSSSTAGGTRRSGPRGLAIFSAQDQRPRTDPG